MTWRRRLARVPWSVRDYLTHLVTNQETEMNAAMSQNIAARLWRSQGWRARVIEDSREYSLFGWRHRPWK